MNKQKVFNHCFNCTTRDNTLLPDKYQGCKLTSVRGVNLCPRCQNPEVATVNVDYEPSKGYTSAEYIK